MNGSRGTLVLFDVDGTLIDPGGAGRAAVCDAFRSVYGVDLTSSQFVAAGRVDGELFAAVAAGAGLDLDFDRVAAAYLAALPGRLRSAPARVLPGVQALLDALRRLPQVVVGLETGNLRLAAEIKLSHFGLWERLACDGPPYGGFAEDGPERSRLVARAVERAGGGFARVVVVGDAPQDVGAARANGAFALAVGTGYCPPEVLLAAAPDAWADDLTDTRAVVRLLLGEDAAGLRRP